MINSKLRSRKGATLLFALVAMLVAVIVSAVIIYAAMSNVGRIRQDQAAEQAQLTLNSAASLVRKELADDSISMTATRVTINKVDQPDQASSTIVYTSKNAAGNVVEKYNNTNSGTNTVSSTNLSYLEAHVLNWVAEVAAKPDTSSCKATFTLKASGMEDVKVTLVMEPGSTGVTEADETKQAEKYYLTAYLYFADSGVDSETIRLTFMSSVSSRQSSPARETTSKTDEYGHVTNVEKMTYNETTTISWADSGVVVNVFASPELAGLK